jgi:hypothetical protein
MSDDDVSGAPPRASRFVASVELPEPLSLPLLAIDVSDVGHVNPVCEDVEEDEPGGAEVTTGKFGAVPPLEPPLPPPQALRKNASPKGTASKRSRADARDKGAGIISNSCTRNNLS